MSSSSGELTMLVESLLESAREVTAVLTPTHSLRHRLARKVSILAHMFEEIRDFAAGKGTGGPAPACLVVLLRAVRAVGSFAIADSDEASTKFSIQFHYVTWQLEKALEKVPYDDFDISDEVREQVDLVRSQLRRSVEKDGSLYYEVFTEIYSILLEIDNVEPTKNATDVDNAEVDHEPEGNDSLQTDDVNNIDSGVEEMVIFVAELNLKPGCDLEIFTSELLKSLSLSRLLVASKNEDSVNFCELPEQTVEEMKRPDPLQIPEDFRCPISLELMRDPVIVATGQTYERSSIQRWMDGGNKTCPKTQQKLHNLTLTPNHVLRSLIMVWCEANNFEQTHRSSNGRIRKSDGTYLDVSGDRAVIDELTQKLSNGSLEEQRSSAAELRSLAKRSTDNRILIAEAGAIPVLINMLSMEDEKIQEHTVTALLNLSIYDNNKRLIMLAGGVTPIIHVIRSGSMEARENGAAAIFSLSLIDENKITIGSMPGVIDELVELLRSGSFRGKKDAATALFNLCIYQGNKARAIRAGILSPLLEMLTNSSNSCMIDEALTILSVLVSHPEGRVAIKRANMVPILVDLLTTIQPRNRENAAAVLLALCKKDHESLAHMARLGASVPLTELANNGTDRAKRKANSLLEHINRSRRV